jgi:hypothetical protein
MFASVIPNCLLFGSVESPTKTRRTNNASGDPTEDIPSLGRKSVECLSAPMRTYEPIIILSDP